MSVAIHQIVHLHTEYQEPIFTAMKNTNQKSRNFFMSSPPEQKHRISNFEVFHLKIKMINTVQMHSLICHITPLSNNMNLIRNVPMTHYIRF